jgi:hypothetical protein
MAHVRQLTETMQPSNPAPLSRLPRTDPGASALEHLLRGEFALILGRLGREVEASLAHLETLRENGDLAMRTAALYSCADAVWRYLVQREVLGLTRHEPVIEFYRIPAEVLARVGAAPPYEGTPTRS